MGVVFSSSLEYDINKRQQLSNASQIIIISLSAKQRIGALVAQRNPAEDKPAFDCLVSKKLIIKIGRTDALAGVYTAACVAEIS